MSDRPAKRISLSWDGSHCQALAWLLAAWLAGQVAWAGLVRQTALGEPVRVDRARAESVRERIDPNTADVASLRRLPLIGVERAAGIVRYRQAFAAHAGGPAPAQSSTPARAFAYREDLDRVPGIGPGIVGHVGKYLSLPSRYEPSASQAAP